MAALPAGLNQSAEPAESVRDSICELQAVGLVGLVFELRVVCQQHDLPVASGFDLEVGLHAAKEWTPVRMPEVHWSGLKVESAERALAPFGQPDSLQDRAAIAGEARQAFGVAEDRGDIRPADRPDEV